jgi:hypothetical protein
MKKQLTTKAEITAAMKAEGIKSSYSGKNRTFYTSALPSGNVLADAEIAGFNIDAKNLK